MNKWAPIAPTKSGGTKGAAGPSPSSASSAGGMLSSFGAVLKPSKAGPSTSAAARARAGRSGPRVGRWPEDIIVRIVAFLPVHDVPAFARANRALARIARDEGTWEARCRVLGISEPDKDKPRPPLSQSPVGLGLGLGSPSPSKSPSKQLPATQPQQQQRKASGTAKPRATSTTKPRQSISSKPPRFSVDDEFGDFGEAGDDVFEDVDFGDFVSPKVGQGGFPSPAKKEKNLLDFGDMPLPSKTGSGSRQTGFFALVPSSPIPTGEAGGAAAPGQWYHTYQRVHIELVPLCQTLRSSPSPSSTLSLLFPPDARTGLTPTLEEQGDRLLALIRFLSPTLQPLHDWGFLRQALLAAADRFDSTCLVAFEVSDTKKDQHGMQAAAEASWKVWEAGGGRRDEWECGRVWIEKREVFYDTVKWDATENIIKVPAPSGTALVRELDFTPMDAFMSHVLESFKLDAELAVKVFPPGARIVHAFADRVAMDVIGEYISTLLGQTRIMSPEMSLRATAASFVQAWKLVDAAVELLGEQQTETPRTMIEHSVYQMFEPHMDEYLDDETEWVQGALDGICNAWDAQLNDTAREAGVTPTSAVATPAPRAGANSGPQFLTSQNPDQVKRNVLASFRDILLIPVTIVPRTVTFGVNAIVSGSTHAVSGLAMLNPQKWVGNNQVAEKGQRGHMVNGEVVFDQNVVATPDDYDEKRSVVNAEDGKDDVDNLGDAVDRLGVPDRLAVPSTPGTPLTPGAGPSPTTMAAFDRLQLLVSIDTALELIHGDREALKRAETFAKYPGKSGTKVYEAIEEVFILLLKAVGDRHIAPGFRVATEHMLMYKPAEHEETQSVAPLLQFFELVHVGDTIQSMVQVYFDKEVASYVDKTDFLNPVMREKKRFESVLDDAVAAGLNAGIEVLMNQVEHIILVKTGPREYYPEPGAPMELGATVGCQEAIKCLTSHCNLLKGSTTKEVLEVFYQEVGIRLQAILQRHLKRQIISLEGGFQIIADLNAYYSFVQSLKQQRITDDFANLKMLGHVFIVSDAKDLAQIVRDVTRYGGTFTPEDIYEFIQRRSDWKKIEKTVDKAMYALSVREDCVIM